MFSGLLERKKRNSKNLSLVLQPGGTSEKKRPLLSMKHRDRHQTKLHTQYYNIFNVFLFDDSVHWLTDQFLSISQSFPQMLTSIHRPDAAKSWLQMSVCHEGLILHLTLILMSLMMGGGKLMWIIGCDAIWSLRVGAALRWLSGTLFILITRTTPIQVITAAYGPLL